MFDDVDALDRVAFSLRFRGGRGNRISPKQLLRLGLGVEHGKFEFIRILETISGVHFHGSFDGSSESAGYFRVAFAQGSKLGIIHCASKAIFRDHTGQGGIQGRA